MPGTREAGDRRIQDPAYERLTFCLLGVATPADLNQDVRATTESGRANQMLVRLLERDGTRLMDEGDPISALVWFVEARRREREMQPRDGSLGTSRPAST